MAIPTFVGASTWQFNANNVPSTITLSPTKHASTANGDLMVLVSESRTIAGTAATPSGWNLVSGFPKTSGTASGGRAYIWTRIADGTGSDAPSVVWTGHTTGTSGDTAGAGILTYSGGTETLDGTAQVSDLAAQTNTSVIPAFTTGSNNSMVIGVVFKIGAESGTSTVATFTERVDTVTTSGTGHVVEVSDKLQATAGSSGTATVTWSLTTSLRALAVSVAFDAGVTTLVPQTAAAVSGASIDLGAPTVIALDEADAVSGAANLPLFAPRIIPLDPANAVSTATGDVYVPVVGADLVLNSAGAVSTASNATITIAVQAVVAEVALVVPSSSVASSVIPTDPAGAVSGSSNIGLSAKTTIPTQSADAVSTASGALSAKTAIAGMTAAAVSGGSAAVSAKTTIATGAANAVTTASNIGLTAATWIALQQADAVTSASNVSLTARTIVPLQVSSAVSTAANLALSAVPSIPLQAANAVTSAAAILRAQTAIPLQTAAGVSSAAALLRARTTIPLQTSAAQSGAAVLDPHVPHLVPISVPGFLTIEDYRTHQDLDSAESQFRIEDIESGMPLEPNRSDPTLEDYDSEGGIGARTGSLRVDG